jgi:hypothetical protein
VVDGQPASLAGSTLADVAAPALGAVDRLVLLFGDVVRGLDVRRLTGRLNGLLLVPVV